MKATYNEPKMVVETITKADVFTASLGDIQGGDTTSGAGNRIAGHISARG